MLEASGEPKSPTECTSFLWPFPISDFDIVIHLGRVRVECVIAILMSNRETTDPRQS